MRHLEAPLGLLDYSSRKGHCELTYVLWPTALVRPSLKRTNLSLTLHSHSMHISLGCILILASQALQTLSQSAITQYSGMSWQPEISGISNASIPFALLFNVSENYYFDRNDINTTDRQIFNADSRTQAALLTSWAYYLSPKPTSHTLT